MNRHLVHVLVVYLFAGGLLLSCSDPAPRSSPKPGQGKYASLSWTPQNCPTLYDNPRQVEISIDRWQAKAYDTRENYANNINRPWVMLFSQNVAYVSPYFSKFRVADEMDRLELTHQGGTTVFSHGGATPPLNQPLGPYPLQPGFSTTKYLQLRWTTGAQENRDGYEIDRMMILCTGQSPPPENATYAMRNYPHEGYLLSTNDVIYLWTKQPAGYEMGFLLWPYAEQGAFNFDLCVSTTSQTPNYTNSTCSTLPSSRPDMVILPPWGQPGQGERDVYIAIGSQDGSGQFRFYANLHTNQAVSQYPGNAFVPFSATTYQKNQIRTQMRKITQAAYFLTDGRHLIRNWDVHWNWPYPEPFFFGYIGLLWGADYASDACHRDTSMDRCDVPDGWVHFSHDWCGCSPTDPFCQACPRDTQWDNERWAAEYAMHEMGHCTYGVGDDYMYGVGCDHCGHSVMGLSWQSKDKNNIDFCDSNNGGHDPTGICDGHRTSENNWDCIKDRISNYIPYPAGFTPDPFFRTA